MIITMRGWLEENPILAWTVWFQVALGVLALLAMPFDKRLILGINPWIKPLKFDVSIAIFLLTMAAILSGLQGFERTRGWIGGGVGIVLSIENFIISMQAFRGVRSHMNFSTLFDARLFAIMGIMAIVSTALIAWALGVVLIDRTRWPSAVAWGVRLGLLAFLAGSVEGILMLSHGGHTVGAVDGLRVCRCWTGAGITATSA